MVAADGRPSGAALDDILAARPRPDEIAERLQRIRAAILAASTTIREAQFSRISNGDLEIAFDQYDAKFFGGLLRSVLGTRPISFRLSQRATSRGGSLAKWPAAETPSGARPERYELTVSTTLLFGSFRDGQRPIVLCGFPCTDRLDALMRVVEHELVHLVEHLRWGDSDCERPRFQAITGGLFGHTNHRHELVTPREHAADLGFRPGQRVAFDFDGSRHVGVLARVTKRATVMVLHPDGEPMRDGRRYRRYYVPLHLLQSV
jgi:hypothetical protein